jgi:hypothetical protein
LCKPFSAIYSFCSFTAPYLPDGSITLGPLLPTYYLWAITLPAFDPLTARLARDNGDTVPLGGWTGWPRAGVQVHPGLIPGRIRGLTIPNITSFKGISFQGCARSLLWCAEQGRQRGYRRSLKGPATALPTLESIFEVVVVVFI